MAPDLDLPQLRFRLAEILVPLAASPEEQLDYFRRTGESPDELALSFDWTRQWSAAVRAADLISETTTALLDQLEEQLGTMSGREHLALWKGEAMNRAEWGRVRTLARAAIDSLRVTGVTIPSIEDDLLRRSQSGT